MWFGLLLTLLFTGFINETALVLYVYLPGSWNGEESCLTVSFINEDPMTMLIIRYSIISTRSRRDDLSSTEYTDLVSTIVTILIDKNERRKCFGIIEFVIKT